MIVTLDVSAAVKLVIGGKYQDEIINILNNADWVISPSLFIYEASNTLWKYYEYENYSKKDIIKKLDYLYRIIDQFIDAKDIYEEALPLSCKINHPTYYTMYLVTSRRKNATLVTLDKKLIKLAKNIDIPVSNIY